MEEPIQFNSTHSSKSKEVQNSSSSSSEKFDVNEFQAKLDTSLGNLYRLVDSWIPTNLRTTSEPLSSRSFEPLKPALQPRLGIGAKPKRLENINFDQLKNQLLKRKSSINSIEEINSKIQIESNSEIEEDQDSRTKTLFINKLKIIDKFSTKSGIHSIIKSSSNQIETSLKLTKKQIKKRRKLENLLKINQIVSTTEETDEVSTGLQTEVSNSMCTTPDTDISIQSISSIMKPQLNKKDESNSVNSMIFNPETKTKEKISLIPKSNHLTSVPSTPESENQKTNNQKTDNQKLESLNPITLSKKQIKKQRNKAKKKIKKQEMKESKEEKERIEE